MEVAACGSCGRRQVDLDRQSPWRRRARAHRTAVALHDLAHDGEPETRAAQVARWLHAARLVATIEPLEHVAQLVRAQAGTVVLDGQPPGPRRLGGFRQLD